MKEEKENLAVAILRREFDNFNTHGLEGLNQIGDAIDKLSNDGEVIVSGKVLEERDMSMQNRIMGYSLYLKDGQIININDLCAENRGQNIKIAIERKDNE